MVDVVAASCTGVPGKCWTGGAGGAWKRVRLTKKTDSCLVHRGEPPHLLRARRLFPLGSGDFLSGKRRRVSLHFHGGSLRREWSSPARVVCTVPRLQVRAGCAFLRN